MHQPVVAKPVLAPRSTLTGRTGPEVHQGHGYVGEHGGTAHDMEETWEQTRKHSHRLCLDPPKAGEKSHIGYYSVL